MDHEKNQQVLTLNQISTPKLQLYQTNKSFFKRVKM